VLTAVNASRDVELTAVALAVLRRDGPAGLTMRNVAVEAGITATALYRHFKDKDELVRAVVREAYAVFRSAMSDDVPQIDPHTLLRLAMDRFVRFAIDHPNYYRLLFIEPHGFGIDRYPYDFANGKSPTFRVLKDIVARCMTARVLRGSPKKDAADVALTVYAHMHGHVALYLAGRFPDAGEFQAFCVASLDRLIVGLA